MDNFLFCPPDKLQALVFLFFTKSKSSIIFVISESIFSFGTDLKTQNISKCSSTVKSSNKTSCWGQIPKNFLKLSNPSEVIIFSLLYIADPADVGYSPVKILIKVLFPAPL